MPLDTPLDITPQPARWLDEIGELPARYLGGLPVTCRLTLRLTGREPESQATALSEQATALSELPAAPCSLGSPGGLGDFAELQVLSCELPEPRETDQGVAVLDRLEWEALVLGTEAGRFLPEDLLALHRAKLEDPGVRLTIETALAGIPLPDEREALSLRELLARLAAEPIAVDLVDHCEDLHNEPFHQAA